MSEQLHALRAEIGRLARAEAVADREAEAAATALAAAEARRDARRSELEAEQARRAALDEVLRAAAQDRGLAGAAELSPVELRAALKREVARPRPASGATITGEAALAALRAGEALVGVTISGDLDLSQLGEPTLEPGEDEASLVRHYVRARVLLVGCAVEGALRSSWRDAAGRERHTCVFLRGLAARGCWFGGGAELAGSWCRSLELVGCGLGDALRADGLEVDDAASLRGLRAAERARLEGARIAGELDLAETWWGGRLELAGARVAGDLCLSGATGHEWASLQGARVSGGVDLAESRWLGGLGLADLVARGDVSATACEVFDLLDAPRLRCGGGLTLGSLRVVGRLQLEGARSGEAPDAGGLWLRDGDPAQALAAVATRPGEPVAS